MLSPIADAGTLPWVRLAPGFSFKLIRATTDDDTWVELLRVEPGTTIPRHRHTGEELLYMIEGSHADESGEVATGNMSIRPNGCTHNVKSRNGAISLAFLWGGIEVV